jgi:uncharacterized low-complexity protein
MANSETSRTLKFALGATVAGGLAAAPATGLADGNPFRVAELDSGYMVAESDKGEGGQCAGMATGEEKGQEGNCAGMGSGKDKDKAEGKCAGKDKSDNKGGEGKCGEGKCAGA